MKRILLALIILVGCSHHPPDSLRFESEEIKMSVDWGKVRIHGTYYFRNYARETKSAMIFYPFPIDNFHFYPDSIMVNGLNYTKTNKGINIIMHFRPLMLETLRVFYEQKLKANQARYILTTTQNWQRPLDEANFIIDIPGNFASILRSYAFDSATIRNKRIFYYLYKKNFMPKKDLIISWADIVH